MKFKKKKSLGQNFLIDQYILNKIADTGKVGHEDLVIEVGPGSGALTNKILESTEKLSKNKELFTGKKDDLADALLQALYYIKYKI